MFFGGHPFGGGMPGGMPGGGGGGGAPRGDVDTTKLYETLEVDKNASKKDIRKAYMKLSRTHHPDKGGDEHKFKEISAAYEILSDDDKRAQYDKYGLEGVSGDDVGAAGGEDLFSMFFGGGGGRSRRASGPRKGPSVNHPLKVSLEDLYNGKTVKLAVNRKVIQGTPTECTRCKGQGAILEVRQLGPGMITQMQRTCDACNGQAQQCQYKSERKVLEVHVEKGMREGDKITFSGMSDEVPKMEPGDINFIIQEKDHDLFKRKGADLLAVKEVSLNQALCGFTWKIKHLDGRDIVIKSRPGEVIKPEMNTKEALPFVKMLPDEGMPSKGNPFVRGNLYVMFRVKFPEDNELSEEVVKAIQKLLPEPDVPEEYDPMEVEEVHLNPADLRSFGKGGAHVSSNEAHDEDEDGGARPVQCQQS
jgi:DnaJ family protein A protein 2